MKKNIINASRKVIRKTHPTLESHGFIYDDTDKITQNSNGYVSESVSESHDINDLIIENRKINSTVQKIATKKDDFSKTKVVNEVNSANSNLETNTHDENSDFSDQVENTVASQKNFQTGLLNHQNLYSDASLRYNNSEWYSLSGRIGRIKYMAFISISLILYFTLVVVAFSDLLLAIKGLKTGTSNILFYLLLLFSVPVYVYTQIIFPRRRLHDINKSGWWLFLNLFPPASLLLIFWLFFKAGDKGGNTYGLPAQNNTGLEKALAFIFPIFLLIALVISTFIWQTLQPFITDDGLQAIMNSENYQTDINIQDNHEDSITSDNNNNVPVAPENNPLTVDTANSNNLNQNPAADPEVQAAINEALGNQGVSNDSSNYNDNDEQFYEVPNPSDLTNKPSNSPIEKKGMSYDDFLRASETPVMIEQDDKQIQ